MSFEDEHGLGRKKVKTKPKSKALKLKKGTDKATGVYNSRLILG